MIQQGSGGYTTREERPVTGKGLEQLNVDTELKCKLGWLPQLNYLSYWDHISQEYYSNQIRNGIIIYHK